MRRARAWLAGLYAAWKTRWARWRRPALPEPQPIERGPETGFRAAGEPGPGLRPPERISVPLFEEVVIPREEIERYQAGRRRQSEEALARALNSELGVRQLAERMAQPVLEEVRRRRFMRENTPPELFRPGPFGIRRPNYGAVARALIQVEPMPEGVPLIYEREWRDPTLAEPPRPDPMPIPGEGEGEER